ncbi:hypothetical protein [Legionella sainthelensi]|nr:hypothetical protein [Legionella sainthelensi]
MIPAKELPFVIGCISPSLLDPTLCSCGSPVSKGLFDSFWFIGTIYH